MTPQEIALEEGTKAGIFGVGCEPADWIIKAMDRYADQEKLGLLTKLATFNLFMEKLEEKVDEDGGTDDVGEFVMDYFDLWL